MSAKVSIYDGVSCKFKDCLNRVVGASITGTGHVCVGHNLEEWGRSLARSRAYQGLGSGLQSDAARRLDEAHARLKQDGPQLAMSLGGAA